MSGLVVIGSGPAGLGAARAYRDEGGRGPVRIITEDAELPYERPPLSKGFLRGEIEEDELALAAESFLAGQGMEIRLSQSVTRLDADARSVVLDDGTAVGFDVCVVATGSAPVPLRVPGGDDRRVHYLRSLAHARELRRAAGSARSAAVIGSGFIGCEAAASLARSQVQVTLITTEELPQQARLGAQAGSRIAGWLREQGVTLVTGADVRAIEFTDGRARVDLGGNAPVIADLVLVCIGSTPLGDLGPDLRAEKGRIVADTHLLTNVGGVFAAGDVVAAENAAAGRRLRVEHWSDAESMGTIAGTNAAHYGPGRPDDGSRDAQWDTVPGFWSEIGDRQLKYHAWGDGFDVSHLVSHDGGAFTVWYAWQGTTVGVLTHDADADYERGEQMIAEHAPLDLVG